MRTIAVVPQGPGVDFATLAQCANAVQIQVMRDFAPAWGIQAAVAAYPSIAAAPATAAFVFVTRNPNGNGGMHFEPLKPDEAPYAIVNYSDERLLSILLSHEIMEMLVDPGGNKLIQGQDPLDPTRTASFLVEICDPCNNNSYPIKEASGRHVSDFCLPSFFGKGSGALFTWQNSIDAALTVASGGYLTWMDTDKVWHQFDATTGPCKIVTIDPEHVQHALASKNLRGIFDRRGGAYGGGGLIPALADKKIARIDRDMKAAKTAGRKRKHAIQAAVSRLAPSNAA